VFVVKRSNLRFEELADSAQNRVQFKLFFTKKDHPNNFLKSHHKKLDSHVIAIKSGKSF